MEQPQPSKPKSSLPDFLVECLEAEQFVQYNKVVFFYAMLYEYGLSQRINTKCTTPIIMTKATIITGTETQDDSIPKEDLAIGCNTVMAG